MTQYIITDCKGVFYCCVFVYDCEESVIWYFDDSIDFFSQFFKARFCYASSLSTFKEKWLCYDSNCEATELFCNTSNERTYSGTSTTTKSTCDKDHVCAFDDLFDFISIFFYGSSADFWIHSSSETAS